MTLHVDPNDLSSAVRQVVAMARHIDAAGLTARDRANAALTYVLEQSDTSWPLAVQRDILSMATVLLEGGATVQVAAPSPRPVAVSAAAPVPAPAPTPAPAAALAAGSLMQLANEVTRDLSRQLDFVDLAQQTRAEQEATIRDGIAAICEARKLHLNGKEIAELLQSVLAEMLGLGPLEPLLADDSITDIMVNGAHQIYVERRGKLEATGIRFRDNAHVFAIASRIVAAVGRRIDEAQPMVDARLKDGSRVNVAIPPLAIDGPSITIRKFPASAVRFDALVSGGSLSSQMAAFLGLATLLRLNILISGGTGSGKTTLLNALSEFVPQDERIVTIEDAAELRLQQPHVVRFETRPPNVEGKGEVTMRALVRNALRMRPDRIIIGEIRGDEVLDLMQAMNTGHDGSMSTLHANSPREALTRVESMAALAGFTPGGTVVRKQLADAVHLIVQVSRMRDGKRRITSISEVVGMAGDAVTLQDLFRFDVSGDSTRTEVMGQFVHSGFRPKFATRAAEAGLGADLDRLLGV